MTGKIHPRTGTDLAFIDPEHLRRNFEFSGDSLASASAECPAAWSPTRANDLNDLGDNVLLFARPRPSDAATWSPALVSGERLAPAQAQADTRGRMASLMTLSLAAHVALY